MLIRRAPLLCVIFAWKYFAWRGKAPVGIYGITFPISLQLMMGVWKNTKLLETLRQKESNQSEIANTKSLQILSGGT